MLGLDPALGRGELFGELLPALVAEAGVDAPYVPSAPCGGDLPFRTDRGVANYFGVGAYLRPLEDARRPEVRFASECLAFANVPETRSLERRWRPPARDPALEGRRAARRREQLGLRRRPRPLPRAALRRRPGGAAAHRSERYLELSRAVTGEVMAEVFGEWRRGASPCGGGLVLWLRDLVPGAGWGLLDHRGEPEGRLSTTSAARSQPMRSGRPTRGSNGVAVHVANDRAVAARAPACACRSTATSNSRSASATEALELPPHATLERNVESMLGRFVDASWAYRFGPPAQDADRGEPRARPRRPRSSRCRRRSASRPGRPMVVEPAGRLGLEATHPPGTMARRSSRSAAAGSRTTSGSTSPGSRRPTTPSRSNRAEPGRLPAPDASPARCSAGDASRP